MATRKRSAVQRKIREADNIIEEQVEVIDEQLEKVERMMKPYEELAERRNRLKAARRALLGGTRMTGEGGSTLRLEDVVGYVRENPGAAPGQIAEGLHTRNTTVSSHLYRNKDRFINKDGRYWVRDPKEGLNTAEDLEDEEE
jgi:hypothetical protein